MVTANPNPNPKQLTAGYREHSESLAAPYRVPAAYQVRARGWGLGVGVGVRVPNPDLTLSP